MQMQLGTSFIHEEQRSPAPRLVGLAAVVLLHVGLIYALVNGLGKNIIEAVQPPIETRILPDSGPPPADVAPLPPPPPLAPPPPPVIALPEIVIQQPPPPLPAPTPPPPPVQQTTRVPPQPAIARPQPAAARPHPIAPAVPDSAVSAAPVSKGQPHYPPRMLEEEREGRVDVICDIDPQGVPRNCSVTNQVGGPEFVASALDWLRTTARYKPQIRNGVPVATPRHAYSVKFKIDD
jgi:periplasmic protein TonB